MKVYTVWHRESHEFDILHGIYASEADAIRKAKEIASKAFTHGDWSWPAKFPEAGVNQSDVICLHSWASEKNVNENDRWETVSVEEDKIIAK